MKIALVLIDDEGNYHIGKSEDVDVLQKSAQGDAKFLGGVFPDFGWDPFRAAKCAAACGPKAGYGACFARCLADGQACDNGADNCTSI